MASPRVAGDWQADRYRSSIEGTFDRRCGRRIPCSTSTSGFRALHISACRDNRLTFFISRNRNGPRRPPASAGPRRACPTFDLKPLSSGLLPVRKQRLGRAHADLLAGDRLPDRELAAPPPAAAAVGLLLLDDLGLAEGTRAERDGGETRRPCAVRGCCRARRVPLHAGPSPAPSARRPVDVAPSRPAAAGRRSGRGSRSGRRSPSGGGPPRPRPRSSAGRSRTRRWRSSRTWSSPERLAPVLPPEHERAALPPAGAAEPPLPLDDRTAAARAVAEPARVDRGRVSGADDLGGVAGDLGHEPARVEAAALDLPELRLPLARQLRALQAPVPDQGDQVAAQVRRKRAPSSPARCSPARAASR